jgi:uncharacterized protein YukE
MTDLRVDPTALRACANRLDTLSTRAATLDADATAASVPELTWGGVGVATLYAGYGLTLETLHTHLRNMVTGLEKISSGLRTTAENYTTTEQANSDSFNRILQHGLDTATTDTADAPACPPPTRSPDDLSGPASSYTGQWAPTNLPSAIEQLPVVHGQAEVFIGVYQFAKDLGDTSADPAHRAVSAGGDVVSVLGGINDLINEGSGLAAFLGDPVNALINAGLSALLDFVAPVKQLVDLVTGDPDAINAAAGAFATLADKIQQLAADYDAALSAGLAGWYGTAAAGAATTLAAFHQGILGTAFAAGSVATVLQISGLLMTAAESVVKGVLSDLIEWLLVTWLAAQVAAPVTAGASEAAAAVGTEVEAAVAEAEGAEKVAQTETLLSRISGILARIREGILASRAESMTGRLFTDVLKDSVRDNASAVIGGSDDEDPALTKTFNRTKAITTGIGGIVSIVDDLSKGQGQSDQQTDDDLTVN